MKMKKVFKKYAILLKETELLKVYEISYNSKRYKIYILKKIANKHTVIHCLNDCLYYEQRPLFWHLAGKRYGNKVPFFNEQKQKGYETIVVIKGVPDGITAIDDETFASFNNYNSGKINVMIKKHFHSLEV